jgi:hypothetical protein
MHHLHSGETHADDSERHVDFWMFAEPEKQKHTKEIDAILDAGAFILGSNMFGPKYRRHTAEWKG